MSQSINELLLRQPVVGVKTSKTGALINPDNPDIKAMKSHTVAGSLDHKKRIVDMYYHDMRIRDRHVRNGTNYTYDKNNGHLPGFKKSVDFFYSDGSIDPNQIMQKNDPERALPDDYVQGALYDKIVLPDGAYETTDSRDLLNKGMESFARYRSTFGNMSLDTK